MLDLKSLPDEHGHFGAFGGMFVPETLMSALNDLSVEYATAKQDRMFQYELAALLADFAGRPTPLYFAERLTEMLGGPKIYLKREDLLHTGAHKINNALGQILLARRMGKTRIIAETGAGQHGVATATVAARFGFECVIYMGAVDMERQALNVARMRFLGAKVVPVTAGQATLKEAINEAMRDWVTNVRSTHYILGSALGSHPYPMMVRDFQRVIGDEARRQILEREERLPNLLVACVGGGSNAIGLFYPFLNDETVRMIGIEAGGSGILPGRHAARFQGGKLGVLQGTKTYLLANEDGQIELTHSVSAGLDYAAVGPEHSYFRDMGRIEYSYATDEKALKGFTELARLEGIIPALESAHAIAHILKIAPNMSKEDLIIANLSGRGDKDVSQAASMLLKDEELKPQPEVILRSFMWKGRFKQETANQLRRYGESISFDWRLYRYDIEGSVAHASALEKAGLITSEENDRIAAGLRDIRDAIENGSFQFDSDLEDIHMNIEAALTHRIGSAGAKLHTARSRNDQVALDLRLFLREETRTIQRMVQDLQRSLVTLGFRHDDAVLPGYTHLQRAQPVLFAHHLLAYVEMLERDNGRLKDLLKRIDVMPLGSGAIAGSTINLDREYIANLLGFSRVSRNSMDAVSDRDFAVELLAAIALIGMHLSRLSEDLILWASAEFDFIAISDAYTTGSSLMPQKKNPDVAELTRGKTGRLYGNLISLLTTLKGLPMTYNRDMQEDKEPVFDSVDTIKAALGVFAPMMLEIKIKRDRMSSAVADSTLLATDLADYLVKKGIPFRKAHEIIGKTVALVVDRGCSFQELPLEDYQTISHAFHEDVFDVLAVDASIKARTNPGAPSHQNVLKELERWQKKLGS